MRIPTCALLVLGLIAVSSSAINGIAWGAGKPQGISEDANFGDVQVSGVAVTKSGRIFVTIPVWSSPHKTTVAELKGGKLKAYPNVAWNNWDNSEKTAAKSFVSAQSVYVEGDRFLWVLDPAAPKFGPVIKGGPKLVKIDLANNKVLKIILFDDSAAPSNSYLNDVRIDPASRYAYVSDSGSGAIILVDLRTGKVTRHLGDRKETKADSNYIPRIEGREWKDTNGKTPQISVNGIALSSDGKFLYFHCLTAKTLYRVPVDSLIQAKTKSRLAIEAVADTGACDGMLTAANGDILLTSIEENGIKCFHPKDSSLSLLVKESRISFPDSMSIGPNDFLYFTCNQFHLLPPFNGGKDARKEPYRLFKYKLEPVSGGSSKVK